MAAVCRHMARIALKYACVIWRHVHLDFDYYTSPKEGDLQRSLIMLAPHAEAVASITIAGWVRCITRMHVDSKVVIALHPPVIIMRSLKDQANALASQTRNLVYEKLPRSGIQHASALTQETETARLFEAILTMMAPRPQQLKRLLCFPDEFTISSHVLPSLTLALGLRDLLMNNLDGPRVTSERLSSAISCLTQLTALKLGFASANEANLGDPSDYEGQVEEDAASAPVRYKLGLYGAFPVGLLRCKQLRILALENSPDCQERPPEQWIPPQLCTALAKLEHLALNNLDGICLPADIGRLTSLTHLSITARPGYVEPDFHATVPVGLSRLTALRELRLASSAATEPLLHTIGATHFLFNTLLFPLRCLLDCRMPSAYCSMPRESCLICHAFIDKVR